MNKQEILDNAPDSSFTVVHDIYSEKVIYTNQRNVRSLADISRIVELEQIVKQVKLDTATEISSHIESLSSAKEMRIAVDKIQAYYYGQIKEQGNE